MRPLFWAVTGTVTAALVTAVTAASLFSASARDPHWDLTTKVVETFRRWSIAKQAADIKIPALGDSAQLVQGVIHYHAHCGVCHGGPGYEAGDIGQGMYPRPADLKDVATRHTPAELFWIVKNGIKMTGMPAWADHGDEELWHVVALLTAFPSMTPEAYSALVAEGNTEHHHGAESAVPPAIPTVAAPHDLGHGGHKHANGRSHKH